MKIRNFLVKTLSTFFYLGYLPLIPGTFASLAGVFLFYFIKDNLCIQLFLIFFLAILGLMITQKAERLFKQKDARCIVIDEIVGMFLALLFIPYQIKLVMIAFIIFRILDALKPYPADILQRRGGSIGIMADDIIAGLYTNVILQVVFRLATFRGL